MQEEIPHKQPKSLKLQAEDLTNQLQGKKECSHMTEHEQDIAHAAPCQ